MEPTALREKLHTLIDESPADKLEEVYDLLNNHDYSDTFKEELDAEFTSYQKDGESISKEEIDRLVEKLLHHKK